MRNKRKRGKYKKREGERHGKKVSDSHEEEHVYCILYIAQTVHRSEVIINKWGKRRMDKSETVKYIEYYHTANFTENG